MVRDAESILRTGFNELKTSADTYQVAMAFIQTEGAREMAKTVFPESLTNIIIAADKKLEGNDKENFRDFLCLTQAFKDLKENDVAAPFKIFHDDPAKVFIALSI